MKIQDAERISMMLHDLVGGLVTALFIPGVHGLQTTQDVIDRIHSKIDLEVEFLTDSE